MGNVLAMYMYATCMLVLTGPPKVEGVMFGDATVRNSRINQEIKWTAPVLKHSVFQQYIIRFADGLQDLLNKMSNREESEQSNTTLQIDFSASNITYYVHVAVKSRKGSGDFSDPVNITYTSECLWAQVYTMQHLCTKTL